MKRTYIQPKVKTHRLKIETSFMAGPSKGEGGDYTKNMLYNGTRLNPNVNPDIMMLDEDESTLGLPGANE